MSAIGSIQSSYIPTLPGQTESGVARLAKEALAQNLPGVAQVGQIHPAATAQQAGDLQPASFSNILEHAVQQVDGKLRAANVEQGKVLSGETSNLHQSMIAMQEASTAFSLMVEVRNKLVDSYQELMRMQV